MNEEEYLKQRVEYQIAWYSKQASKNKKLNNASKGAVILLASSIPLVTQLNFDAELKNLSLTTIGAAIAIISGLSTLLKFSEKWGKYRSNAERLKNELYLFKTKTGQYQDVDTAFKLLVPKVEEIISTENIVWSELMSKSS
jgi:hypothetical protein